MKKLLTTLLASALAFIMLTFVACATPGDTTYSGNYKEVDSQTLYNATRDLETSINSIPTIDKKAGISISMQTDSNEVGPTHNRTVHVNVSGYMVNYIESVDGGDPVTKELVNLTYEVNIKHIEGETTTTSVVTDSFYANDEGYFIHSKTNSTLNENTQNTETKLKVSQDQFMERLSNTVLSILAGASNTDQIPTVETEFISYIDNLKTNAGYRIAIDDSKGLKVKVDIVDKLKFAEHFFLKNPSPTIEDIELNKMETYYVFDEDKNLIANKVSASVNTTYSYNRTMTSISNVETKVYTGNVSFPSNLDSYTDTTLND